MTATRSSDPQAFETLLRAVVRAARSGNLAAARALAHAITTEYPNEARAWIALAGVVETPQEQRAALERAHALDPGNEQVQRTLEHLASTSTVPEPAEVTVVSDAPSPVITNPPLTAETPPQDTRNRTWSRWLVLLVLLLLLLPTLGYAMTGTWRQSAPPALVSTPTLADSIASGTDVSSTSILPSAASEATLTTPRISTATGLVSSPTSVPLPTLAASPATLAPGAVVALDNWHVSLPRQDYAMALDGNIGDTAPRGRFVLALVALANTTDQPRTLPANLFVLTDNRGRVYPAQPSLSSAYLAAYGRAQRGDLSMEDAMPAGGGYFSVPILFDVPTDASGLRLSVGDGSVGGWDIMSTPPATPTQ